jgi:hypothetical protein
MTALTWDDIGERYYDVGIDHAVFYPPSPNPGVPWNGLISVEETPIGADPEPSYFEGDKYIDIISNETYQATLTSWSQPSPWFEFCLGQRSDLANGLLVPGQSRMRFGMCYRTMIGNGPVEDYGYKLHLIYNLVISETGKTHKTDDSNKNPVEYKWIVHATPPFIENALYKPTAEFIIDSREADPAKLQDLEDLLYGTVSTDAELPDQITVITTLS